MRFLDPSLFWMWAALAAVPVVLYLFRPRPKTVPTSTLPFFLRLARHYQDATWLRRLKRLLSLLLSLLVIVGMAAALGRLVTAPADDALQTVVVLVDRSASMGAVDERGTTRLAAAVAQARARLAGLPAAVGVIVIAYDARPEVLLSRSTERRQVDRALVALRVRPLEGHAPAALRLAGQLAGLERPSAVWHFTDAAAASQPPDDAAVETRVEHFAVGLPQPANVGLTGFALRRVPLELGRMEAFVQVHSAGDQGAPVELELRLDDELVAIRKLVVPPRGRERLLVPLEAAAAERVVSLRVSAEQDALAADNVVLARVPALRPLRVLWLSAAPDPFTELALSSLTGAGELEVLHAAPSAWPPQTLPDVAIFDGWLPAAWPDTAGVIVINPPGALGPVRAVRLAGEGLPLEAIRAVDRHHPLLYGVATARLALRQTAVVEATGALESLWLGEKGPVLLCGESRGQRIAVMAFSPQRSEQLPLTSSYPLLMGNAIFWSAAERLEASRGLNRRTGELVETHGKPLHWRAADKTDAAASESAGPWAELDRVGLWEVEDGPLGAAALLSPAETLLPAAPNAADDATAVAGVRGGEWSPWLLWGVLGILLGESLLFHRLLAC